MAKAAAEPQERRRGRAGALGWSLAGAAALLALMALGGGAYLAVGGYNVAASRPHTQLTYWLTHTMMVRSVKLRAHGLAPPARASGEAVRRGFRIYAAHCAACHGAPAVDVRARWADGLTPPPPFLVEAARDWTPGELFWIVKHGVKMTGMPAWEQLCTDAEIWDVVAFLEALPAAPPSAYRDRQQAEGVQPEAGSADATLRSCAPVGGGA